MMVAMVLIAVVSSVLAAVVVSCALLRLLVAQVQQQWASEREASLRGAVDTVVALADAQLGQRSAAGAHHLDVTRDAIGRQLADMGAELRRVNDLVGALQRDRANQHGQVVAGLQQTLQAATELTGHTRALREALASPRVRGQWGERMADDVLRAAGFAEGVNYRKQVPLPGGTVPDFTFLLPRDVLLHMDVKFPLDNYLRCLEASTEAEVVATRAAFLRDVRQRVKELAGRGYADPATTCGYLLLFIPNESVYAFIGEHDTQLSDTALRQGVVLCSPFTLFAVLGVVRQAADMVQLQRASDEILTALGGFSGQWAKFSEHLDKLGKQLGTAQGTYEELAGVRRRQMEKSLDVVEALRAGRPGPDDGAAVEPVLREVSSCDVQASSAVTSRSV
jgi:DNA recombination protein RmuC